MFCFWSLYEEIARRKLYECLADPGSHFVCGRCSEVDIEDPYSDHHAEGDKDHSEEKVRKKRKTERFY